MVAESCAVASDVDFARASQSSWPLRRDRRKQAQSNYRIVLDRVASLESRLCELLKKSNADDALANLERRMQWLERASDPGNLAALGESPDMPLASTLSSYPNSSLIRSGCHHGVICEPAAQLSPERLQRPEFNNISGNPSFDVQVAVCARAPFRHAPGVDLRPNIVFEDLSILRSNVGVDDTLVLHHFVAATFDMSIDDEDEAEFESEFFPVCDFKDPVISGGGLYHGDSAYSLNSCSGSAVVCSSSPLSCSTGSCQATSVCRSTCSSFASVCSTCMFPTESFHARATPTRCLSASDTASSSRRSMTVTSSRDISTKLSRVTPWPASSQRRLCPATFVTSKVGI